MRKGLSCAALLCIACATSPLGRSQLKLFPDAEMGRMGIAAFEQLKSEMPTSRDARTDRYVRCVADAITRTLPPSPMQSSWEVVVFEDGSPNAFALPGGKIGVHTGLLMVASDQDQLATVIGHEVAHVLAGHSNERVSTAFATESSLQILSTLSGASSPAQRQLIGLLGAGAQIGILLPFSRAQETEADKLGLDLMADAGFDPRASVTLWQNMSALGGAQPPEFLSTHPANTTRIQELRNRIPSALPRYEKARASGRRPRCG